MKILALTKYGDLAASTRHRLLQFRPALAQADLDVICEPLLDNDYLRSLSTGRGTSLPRVAGAYLTRLRTLLTRRDFDALWVHYELFPYLFGTIERLAFISGRPVIYDFDDATFHQYDGHANPLIHRLLSGKLEPLLKGVAACSCGNAYLEAYAKRFCSNTAIIPTSLDTTVFVPADRPRATGKRPVIGWIGSPSTWSYVLPLVPVLQRLSRDQDLDIRIVGAGARGDASTGFDFVDWSEETEVAEIQSMDIGIMPIPDEPWARGKCGFKLIQYMACGLPVVASPVGVNTEIVTHGEEGYLATTEEDWSVSLGRLARDHALRESMGALGRRKIEANYSLAVQAPRLIDLFRSVLG